MKVYKFYIDYKWATKKKLIFVVVDTWPIIIKILICITKTFYDIFLAYYLYEFNADAIVLFLHGIILIFRQRIRCHNNIEIIT